MGRNLPPPTLPQSPRGLHPGLGLRGCGPQSPLASVHSSAKRGQCMSPTDKREALNSQTPIRTLQSLCSQANESCVGAGSAQGPTFLPSLLSLWVWGQLCGVCPRPPGPWPCSCELPCVLLIQLSPRLLPCKPQHLGLALPQPPRVQGPTSSLPCLSAQGTRSLELPPNVAITGGYSFSSVSSALLLSIMVRGRLCAETRFLSCEVHLLSGTGGTRCSLSPGPPPGVLCSASCLPQARPSPQGLFPRCSWPRASHALFPVPTHFLFFTCLGSEGCWPLPSHSLPSLGVGDP